MKNAGAHKEPRYRRMKDKNLGVKLAADAQGHVGGTIRYLPAECSFAEGKDLCFIPCIWGHGHKSRQGNLQSKGMGRVLLWAAEEDILNRCEKGVAARGLLLPYKQFYFFPQITGAFYTQQEKKRRIALIGALCINLFLAEPREKQRKKTMV